MRNSYTCLKSHNFGEKFIHSLDVYENDGRLEKVQELQALITQGEAIEEFILDGNIHTDN